MKELYRGPAFEKKVYDFHPNGDRVLVQTVIGQFRKGTFYLALLLQKDGEEVRQITFHHLTGDLHFLIILWRTAMMLEAAGEISRIDVNSAYCAAHDHSPSPGYAPPRRIIRQIKGEYWRIIKEPPPPWLKNLIGDLTVSGSGTT